MTADHLPEFEEPPVTETVLSVRFRELTQLTAARVGQFWQLHLVGDLPTTQDRPPYTPPVERFGEGANVTLDFALQSAGVPRVWFEGGPTIVQVQPDWFACNWRRTDDHPTYARHVEHRRQFEHWWSLFKGYVADQLGAEPSPTQCEVTYVNQVDDVDPAAGPFGGVVRGLATPVGGILPLAEGGAARWAYVIPGPDGSPVGRLHISLVSTTDSETGKPGVQLTLTARGAPQGDGDEGVLRFFEVGHEWVVQGFKDMTTESMWSRWGLREERT